MTVGYSRFCCASLQPRRGDISVELNHNGAERVCKVFGIQHPKASSLQPRRGDISVERDEPHQSTLYDSGLLPILRFLFNSQVSDILV